MRARSAAALPTERSLSASTALAVVATTRKHPLQLKKRNSAGGSQKMEGFFLVGRARVYPRKTLGLSLHGSELHFLLKMGSSGVVKFHQSKIPVNMRVFYFGAGSRTSLKLKLSLLCLLEKKIAYGCFLFFTALRQTSFATQKLGSRHI